MRLVKIITDSCADLTGEMLEKYDIDYVKMSTIEDGAESPALLTWSKEDSHALYEKIRAGKRITTAQVTVEEFTAVFTRYLDAGMDIFYIACAAKQTGSVNTGRVVAQKLMKKREGAQIVCLDSLNACIGEGMLAMEAAKLAKAGKGIGEIVDTISAMRKNVLEFVAVHTLEYLRRAGRVSASSAFFGNLMGIKPILVADTAGAQAAYKKVKGRQNSMLETVRLLKENIQSPQEQTVYIVHADCQKDEVDFLVREVKKEIPCKDVCVCGIGPIIGASVGPDCIGVYAFGKTVTFTAQ